MAARKRKRRRVSRHQKSWWRQIPGWIWMFGAGFALLLLGLGLSAQEERTSPTIDPSSPELVTQGKVVYDETCAVCHGPNGEGDVGSPLNGSAHAWHHVDNQLRSFIRNGIPGTQMVGHGDHLTPEEIDAAISYIKTWWTPEQRKMQRTGRHPMG